MPDTVRTESALQTIFADNAAGDIDEQDLRDLTVSIDIDDVTGHLVDTANPHSTSIANLDSSTMAEVNAAISDATLTSGFNFTVVTGSTQTMSAGGRYIADNDGSKITFTLPASASAGDSFLILGQGTAGWQVESGASGDVIRIAGEDSASASGADEKLLESSAATNNVWLTYNGSKFEANLFTDGDLTAPVPFNTLERVSASGTNGRVSGDWFGHYVDIDGDTCAVSAYQQDYDADGANNVAGAGAVYVYVKSGGSWSLQQKIVAEGTNSRIASDFFGISLELDTDNDTLIVGSHYHDYDANGANHTAATGAAYIYTRSGSAWSLQQKIVAEGTNGRHLNGFFGSDVSINGDTCVVGSYGHNYNADGTVGTPSYPYIGGAFVYTRSGSTWSFQQKLLGEGTNGRVSNDNFGQKVSISGETIAIGATGQDYDENGANNIASAGAVYVYTRSGSTWSLQQKLVGTGTNGRVSYDQFGSDVALDGDNILVGAYGQDFDENGANNTSYAGAAFIFTRSGSTWSLQQKIYGEGTNGRVTFDYFGKSVGLDGDYCIVGAEMQDFDADGANQLTTAGAAYIFSRSGSTWTQLKKVVGEGTNGRAGGDYYGAAVSCSGITAIVGSPKSHYDSAGTSNISDSGQVFIYT